MKEVFKESGRIRINVFLVLILFTFMWLLSDFPWVSIIVGGLVYYWFGSKHFHLVFYDNSLEVVYPFMKWKNVTYSVDEVEAVYHLILNFWPSQGDLLRVNTRKREYKISIDREPEDFRKINMLIHHENWTSLVKTKGDASTVDQIIKLREEGWED